MERGSFAKTEQAHAAILVQADIRSATLRASPGTADEASHAAPGSTAGMAAARMREMEVPPGEAEAGAAEDSSESMRL